MKAKIHSKVLVDVFLFTVTLLAFCGKMQAGAYNFNIVPAPETNKDIVIKKNSSVWFSCAPSDYQGTIDSYLWTFENSDIGASSDASPGIVTFSEDAEGEMSPCTFSISHTDENDVFCPNSEITVAYVIVPKVEKKWPSHELWYLNGATAYAPYFDYVELKVTDGGRAKSYTWEVSSGSSLVSLSNSSSTATRVDAEDSSANENDVTVSLMYSGNEVGSQDLTVYTPQYYNLLFYADIPTTVAGLWFGFETEAHFEMTDQFDRPMNGMRINEQWHYSERVPYVSNNWGGMANVGGLLDGSGRWYDLYAQTGGLTLFPASVTPSSAFSWDQVFYEKQHYRCGSQTVGEGVLVEIHNTDYCKGRARQW